MVEKLKPTPLRIPLQVSGKLDAWALTSVAVILAVFTTICLWINSHNIDISYLALHDIDENAFIIVLQHLFDGYRHLKPQEMMNISFFNYGYGYFMSMLLVSAPWLATGSYSTVVFIARCQSLFWVVATLGISGYWIRRRTEGWVPALLMTTTLIAMPAFLDQAIWIHPEAMYGFFMTATLLVAAEIDPAQKRKVLGVALICGMAFASKFQTITYWPFAGLLLAARRLWPVSDTDEPTAKRLVAAIGVGLLFAVGSLAAFLILDPYMLHPIGLGAFIKDTRENLESNRTNHFHAMLPTAADKFLMLRQYFAPAWLVALAVLAVGAAGRAGPTGWRVRWRELVPELTILATGLVTAIYFFTTVQKAWPHYYILSYVLIVIGLVTTVGRIWGRAADKGACALSVALIVLATIRAPLVITPRIASPPHAANSALQLAALISGPKGATGKPHPVIFISPSTPIDFASLGLSIADLHVIYGPLDPAKLGSGDLVVLRKNDSYFNRKELARRDAIGAALRSDRLFIDQALAGRNADWSACAQSDLAIVLCRATARTAD